MGGYYNDEFLLTIKPLTDDGKIYYTTDGSTPNENSNVYTDGIWIKNRNNEENIYNNIPNVIKNWNTSPKTTNPVEKGTVIKVLYVNNKGKHSPIVTQTYFVGVERPQNGYTLSISFDYDKLFGEDGIYVTGKEYDQWYLSNEKSIEEPTPNFMKKLETDCVVELIDDNDHILNQKTGIRIQGSSKRLWAKKRFIITAREEYTSNKLLDAELFPNTFTHSVMVKEYVTDAMVADIASDRSVGVQRSVPVKVFLNGEFWYNSYMLERYDNQYFRQHYGVDNRYMVKNGEVDIEDIQNNKSESYEEFLTWVNTCDFTQESQWTQLKNKVDIQSYIDYITINYYLCNWDVSERQNYIMWRSGQSDSNTPYGDMRWRWCIYDIDMLEHTLGYYFLDNAAQLDLFSEEFIFVKGNFTTLPLYKAFRVNEEFQKQFVLSFMDMLNNNFTLKNIEEVLIKNGHNLDYMDGYFIKRPQYAKEHLAKEFNLTGSVEKVKISTNQPLGGVIKVNTSIIDLSQGYWEGEYFSDYPITISAQPNNGYSFVGWKGADNSTDKTITVHITDIVDLEAVFVKK